MSQFESYSEIESLWAVWISGRNGEHANGHSELQAALAKKDIHVTQSALRHALHANGRTELGSMSAFVDGMVYLLGAPALRLDHAFGYLAPNKTKVEAEKLAEILRFFIPEKEVLSAILAELDADGDQMIGVADFHRYYPAATAGARRTTHGLEAPIRLPQANLVTAAPKLTSAISKADTQRNATSPLQMQIGFFRLLQGAAYRSFRESYSANAETHERARDLPYTITDFSEFVTAASDFYVSLGLASGAEAEFARLTEMVTQEVGDLDRRIKGWRDLPKTPGMVQAETLLAKERAELHDHQHRFADAVEYLLALRMHGFAHDDVSVDSLNAHDMNRLRHEELHTEHGHTPAQNGVVSGKDYREAWNPVNLSGGIDRPDGAIIPVRFWYDDFMPQLLRCSSAGNTGIVDEDEAALDAWHSARSSRGDFDNFATDLRDRFGDCSVDVKLNLKRAWRLTEHYLNGVEKRREREEFGRESGFLSQYVAFIDVHLGRNDVAESEMRLSFPYYIGPAVWCFLHTAAEIIEAMDAKRKADTMAKFKRFFKAFATMYPCPYCRHHLNRYVVRNREVTSYPVEFLLLGQTPEKAPFDISLDDRLATITAKVPGSMRLFVWKLHNAVSSSIARSEAWYHSEARPLYTTRFWPGLDAEIARARALDEGSIEVERLDEIYSILKAGARLATRRDEIVMALEQDNPDFLNNVLRPVVDEIAALDSAVQSSEFLTKTYSFDPARHLEPPHFTAQEEAFSRSGLFVER